MPLVSMTGFARAEQRHGDLSIQVEARCVNGRSSDIKLRLPSGFDHLDKPVRSAFQKVIRRGNANISVSLQRESSRQPRINDEVLRSLRATLADQAATLGEEPPKLTDLLSLPGVVEMVDAAGLDPSQEEADAQDAAVLETVSACAEGLGSMRAAEGDAMHAVLADLIDAIAHETTALAQSPDSGARSIHARLKAQLDELLGDTSQLDPQRLHQEAAILATKADIEEELARLCAHIDAARDLLAAKEPVGRKLDFLAQEFNREANTICSKAGSITITQHGLALKALIDHVKEQVQNVE